MAIEHYYETIKRSSYTVTPDGRGGSTYVKGTPTEFEGLINDATSQEILMAQQMGISVTAKLFTATTNEISSDEIIQDTNDNYYRVVSKAKNTVHRNHHLKYMLQQVSLDEVF